MDKVHKIREEVARIQLYTQSEVLKQVLDYIDEVQKEPVSEDKMTISKEWFEHCKKSWYNEGYIDGEYNRDRQFEESVSNSDWLTELQEKLDNATPEQLEELWNKYNGVDEEESVSEDLEKIVEEIAEPTILNAYGTKELARRLRNTICGTSVSENLGEYINELSKQFPEVSFAKLSRIAVRVAKWQKEQMKNILEPDTPATAEEIKKMQDKRRYELQKKVQHEFNSQLQEQYDNGYDDGYKDAEKVAYEKR